MSSIAEISRFNTLAESKGAQVLYHRETYSTPCPCRTPEGYRDPEWHKEHPEAPICNARGFLTNPTEVLFKGFVQPVTGQRRLYADVLTQMFGEVQVDDHLGLFPLSWGGVPLDFTNWSQAGDEYVEYHLMRFIVISWNRIPDPANADKGHHWEIGLRKSNI